MISNSFFIKKQLMSSVALVCISPMLLGENNWNKDDTKQICLIGLGMYLFYKFATRSVEEKEKSHLCEVKKEELNLLKRKCDFEIEEQKGINTKIEIERLEKESNLIVFKKEQDTNRLTLQKDRILFIVNQAEQFCSQEDEELCQAFRKNLLKNIEHFQNKA